MSHVLCPKFMNIMFQFLFLFSYIGLYVQEGINLRILCRFSTLNSMIQHSHRMCLLLFAQLFQMLCIKRMFPLQVFALYSSFHIAQLRVGLAEPLRLGQAERVKVNHPCIASSVAEWLGCLTFFSSRTPNLKVGGSSPHALTSANLDFHHGV